MNVLRLPRRFAPRNDVVISNDVMKCPVCKKEMTITQEDESFGKEDKKYKRTAYNCADCDTWTVVEIPKLSSQA